MSHSGLARFIRLGQQADPAILDAIKRRAPSEFKPALSDRFEVVGKRMRAAMVVLICGAAGGRIERAVKPAAVVEMIHNYSLVMDDLIDRGEVRRGRPTVRVVMGDSIALLVAMFYREILDDLIKDSPASDMVRATAVKTMKEIIDGERLDLLLEQAGRTDPYLVKNRIFDPTFRSYLDMVGKKTGKQQAKDIIEHKLGNAAILVAMRFLTRKDRRELKKIIGSEKVSKQMVRKARSIVNKTPAERECREVAMKYLEDAKTSLSILKPSPFKDALSDLADQVVARSY